MVIYRYIIFSAIITIYLNYYLYLINYKAMLHYSFC